MPANLELLQQLATKSLVLWQVPKGTSARLINVSENTTYLVEAPDGFKSILRVHRQGYHSQIAIESEIAWSTALNDAGRVSTPGYYTGANGKIIQSGEITGIDGQHFMTMLTFLDGHHPTELGDPLERYEELGRIAANAHLHAISWQRPPSFQRLTWDEDAVFGPQAVWGNWRNAPNISQTIMQVLESVERKICQRLKVFGKDSERFGLIHSDMRFANLLINGGKTQLIDFDDCGFSWFLYDFASAISFIEDNPRIPEFKTAWLRGYREIRNLPAEEEAEIGTFIMLRRMALLAWVGSHIEAPEPKALAPSFAQITADLGQEYLASPPLKVRL